MASRLNPYVSFGDTARSAMEYYHQVFGGALHLSTFGEMGAPAHSPDADKIMHVLLETERGFTLMAAHPPSGMDRDPGETVAISPTGDGPAGLRRYWEK